LEWSFDCVFYSFSCLFTLRRCIFSWFDCITQAVVSTRDHICVTRLGWVCCSATPTGCMIGVPWKQSVVAFNRLHVSITSRKNITIFYILKRILIQNLNKKIRSEKFSKMKNMSKKAPLHTKYKEGWIPWMELRYVIFFLKV